jgi:hypothetical protein
MTDPRPVSHAETVDPCRQVATDRPLRHPPDRHVAAQAGASRQRLSTSNARDAALGEVGLLDRSSAS